MPKKPKKPKKMPKQYIMPSWPIGKQVIEVTWLDHSSGNGWQDPAVTRQKNAGPLVCTSIGYVICESADTITLTHTQCGTNGDVHSGITIVKGLITGHKLLRRG